MKEEYEIIEYSQLQDINIFMVQMTYRSPHTHKEFEICMILSGVITIYTGNEANTFRKGDMVIFNPYQTHELHSITENTMILSIQIGCGFCRNFFPEASCLKFDSIVLANGTESRDGIEGVSLRDLLLDAAIAYFAQEPNYEFICMGRIYEAFYILLQTQSWRILSERENVEYYNKVQRLGRIIEYTEEHFTEKVLLSDVAKKENLSLSYLSHFFKEMLGISFQQYVALLRFERARRLVEKTDTSLTQICMECGFSDYRYLNRIYKKQLGYTPQEFRNSHVNFSENKEKEEDLINTQRFLDAHDSLQLLELAREDTAN